MRITFAAAPQLRRLRRLRPLAVLVTWLLTVSSFADDTVIVSRAEGGKEVRRKGTIVDYTGKSLSLKLPGGRQEVIPTRQVLGYETELVPDHRNADQLFAERRYADAVVAYRRAVEEDRRTWVRRKILAQMVLCYKNLSQFVRAGETFLVIVRSDPATLHLDAIPLAWKPRQPTPELMQRATSWLAEADSPLARLIGASWLLSTNDRQKSLDALESLIEHSDPRVALSAKAQTWRAALVVATSNDVKEWQGQLQRMDPSARAGPYFVVGQGLARHQSRTPAALTFLKVPILFPQERDLAAESLLAAGEQLQKSGDRRGAMTVYQELLSDHPKHPLVPLAEQRLVELSPK